MPDGSRSALATASWMRRGRPFSLHCDSITTPLAPLRDPVRFGRSDLITCNSRGVLASGTVYLTDGSDRQGAVVVYGATARVRIWEYDLGARRWVMR